MILSVIRRPRTREGDRTVALRRRTARAGRRRGASGRTADTAAQRGRTQRAKTDRADARSSANSSPAGGSPSQDSSRASARGSRPSAPLQGPGREPRFSSYLRGVIERPWNTQGVGNVFGRLTLVLSTIRPDHCNRSVHVYDPIVHHYCRPRKGHPVDRSRFDRSRFDRSRA